jgi:hypothetical protein
MPRVESTALSVVTARQQHFASWVMDILVYIVVLNLFVEFFPEVIAESFTLSILTAVLLKAMLVLMGGVEHRVSEFFKGRDGTIWTVLRFLSVWGILFAGKLLILEVVDLVFAGSVKLGHFLEVVALVVALIAVSGGVRAVYKRLGPGAAEVARAGHTG